MSVATTVSPSRRVEVLGPVPTLPRPTQESGGRDGERHTGPGWGDVGRTVCGHIGHKDEPYTSTIPVQQLVCLGQPSAGDRYHGPSGCRTLILNPVQSQRDRGVSRWVPPRRSPSPSRVEWSRSGKTCRGHSCRRWSTSGRGRRSARVTFHETPASPRLLGGRKGRRETSGMGVNTVRRSVVDDSSCPVGVRDRHGRPSTRPVTVHIPGPL